MKALGEVEVKTLQSWYDHGELTMNYNSTSPLAQKLEKIFEFDNEGQIVSMARSRLMNAWFWSNEHNDALKGDDFCKAFRNELRLARNDEELKNGDVLKDRLDRRCTQLKRDFVAEKLKESVA
jgi:hypothetical protein